MTFRLRDLGSFRIERTEDYGDSYDKTYCEIIWVRGSRSDPPAFTIPSHVYKYSESELALYLKDHKNAWRDLSKVLDMRIDISDEEIILVFPASRFPDIARIIPLVHKRGRAETCSS